MGCIMGKTEGLTNYFIVCEHKTKKKKYKKEGRRTSHTVQGSYFFWRTENTISTHHNHVPLSNNRRLSKVVWQV